MKKEDITQLIDVFAEHTMCAIQHNGSPCNKCMHTMDEEIDYQHIVWLMLLAVRGDYDINDITPLIEDELKNPLWKSINTKTK
jgi:hypothetical protein